MNLTAIISRGAVGVTLTLAAHFLVSCGTPGGGSGGGLSGSMSDSVATPKHGLPRYEYPFDSNGEYKEAWAREGEERQGWNTDRNYADVDFSRGSDDDEKPAKPTRVASRSRSMAAAEKEKEKEKTGGGFFASRAKKQQPVKTEPQPVVAAVRTAPPRQVVKPEERLLASNLTSQNSSTWDRSRIPSSVATYQPPRSQPPAIQPEPTVEVRRAPSVEQARPATPEPVVEEAPPTPKPKPTPKPAPAPAPKRYHVVVKGDTLYNISVRYKSNVASIKSRNKLSSDTIRLGQSLEIP
ncbi:MAG: LysM peptidoglycan-binding domain-containing protein [Verrucomicrobiae bacterium]|nr:LysM peptidoglycan-binding domain-containing protein [Verrucomicrobiae bacterium]